MTEKAQGARSRQFVNRCNLGLLFKNQPTPLIPALKRQRQMDLCEFQAYKVSFRTVMRIPISKEIERMRIMTFYTLGL